MKRTIIYIVTVIMLISQFSLVTNAQSVEEVNSDLEQMFLEQIATVPNAT